MPKDCNCNTCLAHRDYWKDKPAKDPVKTKYQQILNHLIATKQAWCFVYGQGIVSREDCKKYL